MTVEATQATQVDQLYMAPLENYVVAMMLRTVGTHSHLSYTKYSPCCLPGAVHTISSDA